MRLHNESLLVRTEMNIVASQLTFIFDEHQSIMIKARFMRAAEAHYLWARDLLRELSVEGGSDTVTASACPPHASHVIYESH